MANKNSSATLEAAVCARESIVTDLADQFQRFHGFQLHAISDPAGRLPTIPVAVIPEGKSLESVKEYLDEYRQVPERRTGTAILDDLHSFVRHVNRFKSEESAIFADPSTTNPKLVAVLDYHDRVNEDESDVEKPLEKPSPRFMEHRSIYSCPLSDEWKVWLANNNKPMSQADFAAFIEDRIIDVIVPPDLTADLELADLLEHLGASGRIAGPHQLMALSRGLQINVETAVRDAVTLATGELQIQYSETHKDGAGLPIKSATAFLIAIPIFRSGDMYKSLVRLRYRLQGGRLSWHYSLYRVDRTFDDAFKGICHQAEQGTGLPLFVGKPEA